MKIKHFALLTLLTLAGSVPAFSGTSFTATGAIDMIPTSMSDDASIVVGVGPYGTPNLYYTEAGGAVVIGDGCSSGLPAISGDGTTIVGCNVDANGKWNAAKWLGGTSWLDLGTVDGGVSCDAFLSGAYGVNQDGSLAVGLLYLPQLCKANAGTWDLVNGGATVLPAEFGNTTYSRANAVNADGSVIVGWQDQQTGERVAAKWVNGVEEIILTPAGGFNGEALAVSGDGQSIVGINYNWGGKEAWLWRPNTGVMPIDGLKGDFTATDVSDEGRVVVGYAQKAFSTRAFIWRPGMGSVYLDNYLKKQRVMVPAGWSLTSASVISADGNIVYGWGFNPDGMIEMFKVVLH